MIYIKTADEIEKLREGGRRLAIVVEKIGKKIAPGVTAKELDEYAEELIRKDGDEPAFLNYKPKGAKEAYPATLCVSVNEEVVHGIPKTETVFKDGDIVSVDCGIKHEGLYTDHAITVTVGEVTDEEKKMVNLTKESLAIGIKAARAGNHVGDIGHAIESFIDGRYGIVRTLAGHGVGREIHEDPYVPNFGNPGEGAELKPGMVIAIEPMVMLGDDDVIVGPDKNTIITKDGKRAAHFEHTVLITNGEAEILTKA